jgi:hypothetical protein
LEKGVSQLRTQLHLGREREDMNHEFSNELGYKITVYCTNTITKTHLITLELNPKEIYTWNQNNGTSFYMEVKDNKGKVIIDNHQYKSPSKLKFRLLAGEPQVVIT